MGRVQVKTTRIKTVLLLWRIIIIEGYIGDKYIKLTESTQRSLFF